MNLAHCFSCVRVSISAFNPDLEGWILYTERLENYFIPNGIKADEVHAERRAILLSVYVGLGKLFPKIHLLFYSFISKFFTYYSLKPAYYSLKPAHYSSQTRTEDVHVNKNYMIHKKVFSQTVDYFDFS